MRAPSFFLSSTIYDFKDLRSALKYHLEQQGCTVLASEYNDFPKPVDTHSYDACLQALCKADYFVLLIGSRVGGWYDSDARISITQQEYREAYKLHLEGKLKLLILVRSDMWRMREDRRELARHLDTLGLDLAVATSIRNHPSKSVSDAEFVSSFISEVCRNKETKAATDGAGPLPTANWVHTFETYRDVIDVVQTQAFSGLPVEQASVRRLLVRELGEVLRQGLVKFKRGSVYSPTSLVEEFHEKNPITIDVKNKTYADVQAKQWDWLSTISIQIFGRQFHTPILDRALESSAFLKFDLESGSFQEEPVYEALSQLKDEIRSFNSANTSETLSVVFAHTRDRRRPGPVVSIDSMKLLPFLHVLDRWVNIVELSRSVIIYLEGGELVLCGLRLRSPIEEMNAQLDEEKVSNDEVAEFIQEGRARSR